MASKSSPSLSREPASVALMDAFSGFMHAYKTRMRAILSDVSSGDTPSRVMVVVVLRKNGPLPMGSIAAYTGLPKSNITALVDDLEAEGLLRRRGDDVDRRVIRVELTAKGRAICAREYDAYSRSLAAVFDALAPSERAPMLSGLERMTQALRAYEREAGDGNDAKAAEKKAIAPFRASTKNARRGR